MFVLEKKIQKAQMISTVISPNFSKVEEEFVQDESYYHYLNLPKEPVPLNIEEKLNQILKSNATTVSNFNRRHQYPKTFRVKEEFIDLCTTLKIDITHIKLLKQERLSHLLKMKLRSNETNLTETKCDQDQDLNENLTGHSPKSVIVEDKSLKTERKVFNYIDQFKNIRETISCNFTNRTSFSRENGNNVKITEINFTLFWTKIS